MNRGHILTYCDATPDIHASVFVAPTAAVIGRVVVSENASIWFGAVVRGDEVPIAIGANSNIQDNVVIHGDEGGQVIIEDNVPLAMARSSTVVTFKTVP